MDLRFSKTPIFVKLLLSLLILLPLVVPVNFVMVQPGPATNLFPKLLTIQSNSVKSYPADGGMFLLTIYISNPDAKVFGLQALTCWSQAECVAMPRSVFYKRNTTTAQEFKSGAKDMKKSQSAAVVASKALLRKYYPEINLAGFSDDSIKVSLKNTGGPSGGLIFSLGIIELLSPDDLLHGRKIAGTGTISPGGKVGAIGGVEEKILGAKKAGASLLFISKENCAEVPQNVQGIRVVAVDTLEEAYSYLRDSSGTHASTPENAKSKAIQGCTNLGA